MIGRLTPRRQNADPLPPAVIPDADFIDQMILVAQSLSVKGASSDRVVRSLREYGCPEDLAVQIAKGTELARMRAVRKQAGILLVQASVALVTGFAITSWSYNAAVEAGGGKFLVVSGLVGYGIVNTGRAIFFLATGQLPAPSEPTAWERRNKAL
jgi:hypothetical protein